MKKQKRERKEKDRRVTRGIHYQNEKQILLAKAKEREKERIKARAKVNRIIQNGAEIISLTVAIVAMQHHHQRALGKGGKTHQNQSATESYHSDRQHRDHHKLRKIGIV